LTLATNLLNVYQTPLTPSLSPNFSLGVSNGLQGRPGGVAFDSMGNLYVMDFEPTVCCNAGTVDVFTGPIQAGAKKAFCFVTFDCNGTALAFDHNGNLWTADTENGCPGCTGCGNLRKYAPPFCQYPSNSCPFCGHDPTAEWDTGDLGGPAGIAFDAAGNMYVAQESLNDVMVWNASQVSGASCFNTTPTPRAFLCVEEFCGNNPASCLIASSPSSVAIDGAQRLFVGYRDSGVIGVYTPPFGTNDSNFACVCDANVKPAFQMFPGHGLLTAGFMTFDRNGNLFVPYAGDTGANTGGLAIFIPPYSSASAPIFVLTSGLTNPYGIAFGK
jgi:DNA-binding beta-propeller fold protein YncE